MDVIILNEGRSKCRFAVVDVEAEAFSPPTTFLDNDIEEGIDLFRFPQSGTLDYYYCNQNELQETIISLTEVLETVTNFKGKTMCGERSLRRKEAICAVALRGLLWMRIASFLAMTGVRVVVF